MSLTGKCKKFGNSTGFGFITAENGSDVFVHITDCADGMMPAEGDVLSYNLGPSTKKPGQTTARNVTGGSAKQTAEERKNGGKAKGWGSGGKGPHEGDTTSRMFHMTMSKSNEMIQAIEKLITLLQPIEKKPKTHSKGTEIEAELSLQAFALTGKWIPLASRSDWDKGTIIRVNTSFKGDSEDAREVVQGQIGELAIKDDTGDLWISFGKVSEWVSVGKQKFLDGLVDPPSLRTGRNLVANDSEEGDTQIIGKSMS
jgi:cold shock CspA family protein